MKVKQLKTFGLLMMVALMVGLIAAPARAQTSGITRPQSGETISGVVFVEGTATDANFLRYELAFLQDANPGAGWIVFADGDQTVSGGTLAIWDTTVGQNVNAPVFPDGSYQLRLRVVRGDFNYEEYFVTGVVIANSGESAPPPTPLPPTATPPPATLPPSPTVAAPTQPSQQEQESAPPTETPVPTEPPTATPLPSRVVPTPIPVEEITIPPTQPAVLPTLTPFPSPTPRATVEQAGFSPIFLDDEGGGIDSSPSSIIDSVLSFDYSIFGASFNNGVRLALIAFAIFGVYLFVRGVLRWIWRTISSNW